VVQKFAAGRSLPAVTVMLLAAILANISACYTITNNIGLLFFLLIRKQQIALFFVDDECPQP